MKSNQSGEGTHGSALVKKYNEIPRGKAGLNCVEHKPFILSINNHINQFACNNCDDSWQDRINKTIRRRV